jgi:hypothetical protein
MISERNDAQFEKTLSLSGAGFFLFLNIAADKIPSV